MVGWRVVENEMKGVAPGCGWKGGERWRLAGSGLEGWI